MADGQKIPREVVEAFEVAERQYHISPELPRDLDEGAFGRLLEEGAHDVIPLRFDVPYLQMLDEYRRCRDFLVYHKPLDQEFYDWRKRTGLPDGHWKINPTKSGEWKAMCLFGLGARKTKDADFYTDWKREQAKPPLGWTEIAPLCPNTVDFFQKLPLREITRIRFSLLDAGGYVGSHRDSDQPKYFLNIALNMPEDCHFRLNGRFIPFSPGKAFLLNVSKLHELVNFSKEPRIHIIVNCGDLYRLYKYV